MKFLVFVLCVNKFRGMGYICVVDFVVFLGYSWFDGSANLHQATNDPDLKPLYSINLV
jgi:hypothetical protein